MTRDRGAAIVLAMLIAALAAAVAATVFADQQRWGRTVEHRRDQVQAQALAMAGVQWARQILDDDARRSDLDHLGEAWAVALPPIPLDNGEIRGAIVDAQGRLNVNALGDGGASSDLERRRIAALFAQRGGPAGALDALADWIDADGLVSDTGAEDAYYGAQAVPGLTANAPVVRVAELLSVKGVSAPALAAVLPFLTALPAGTPLNVNTAPPEVLAAVVDGLGGESLAGLVASRARQPFATIADFRSRLPHGATLAGEAALAVKSSYFYVSVEARQGTTLARARALLRRAGNAWPVIVWQVVE
jgi:general secretion pathway protein K